MNEKVLSLIAQIIENPKQIQEIHKNANEYYFIYRDRYFSMVKRTDPSEEGDYVFYIYPKASGPLDQVALETTILDPARDYPLVSYNDREFGGDGTLLFHRLYSMLEESHLGLDQLFDEILD
jgi:hypothetical protein